MTTTTHSVISGVSCPVRTVGDGEPHLLENFLGHTEFTVRMGEHPYVVRGCGCRQDDHVRFYEKDDAVGRDIRVWRVSAADEGFQAEHLAAF